MNFLHALVLGTVQGLTEFLPVSSSGHLIFVPKLLGWADQGSAFDAALNIGTLLALIIFFRIKLWNILKNMFSKNGDADQKRLGYLLLLSCIPAAIVGLLMETNDRNALLVGVDMIVWAVVLFVADRYSKKQESVTTAAAGSRPYGGTKKQVTEVTWKDTIWMACAQAVALLPGTSRSGITMTAGLFRKLNRETAAEFSFLMSVPIIALASAHGLLQIVRHGGGGESLSALGVGLIASFVSGTAAIALLMKIIKKWSFTPFVVYRIVVGILILIILV